MNIYANEEDDEACIVTSYASINFRKLEEKLKKQFNEFSSAKCDCVDAELKINENSDEIQIKMQLTYCIKCEEFANLTNEHIKLIKNAAKMLNAEAFIDISNRMLNSIKL